jgi:hypothetical protein
MKSEPKYSSSLTWLIVGALDGAVLYSEKDENKDEI